MLLFRSEGHVDTWCRTKRMPRGALLSLETLWRLADAWYGHKLEPTWRRHTLDEAEALFRELGLEGDFWRLR